jgi:hypothetical protein
MSAATKDPVMDGIRLGAPSRLEMGMKRVATQRHRGFMIHDEQAHTPPLRRIYINP